MVTRSALRPAARELGGLKGPVTVADLHIGTYRTHFFFPTYCLRQRYNPGLLNVEGESPEEAVQDVRDLEVPPKSNRESEPLKANHFTIPLADASCDAVFVGFGTHEIPTGGARDKLFAEAIRI